MTTRNPTPVPPSRIAIRMPQDQYAHVGAPTEWWWHTGTLVCGDRVFGFEINAANFTVEAFTQIMLTDVAGQRHYQSSTVQTAGDWAETDPGKDWYARLGNPELDDDWAWMTAPQADPTQNMSVKAQVVDQATGTKVIFDLMMSQGGAPLMVWGSGVMPDPPQPGGVATNNYYYSLTRMATTGSIAIGDEVFAVTGLTWMDHEYGYFGSSAKPVQWFLQAMQFDNGIHISHYVSFDKAPPQKGVASQSNATIQFPDGTTYYQTDCTVTPVGDPWVAADGQGFYLQFAISIPDFDGELTVTSSVAQQDFPAFGADVYEGVATVEGRFDGEAVSGTAWNEQRP